MKWRISKITPNRDNTISKFVRDYKEKYPDLDRSLLRKLIRLENKITNPSDLKKLDRYLKKEFEIPNHPYVTINGKEPEVPKRGLWIFKREVNQSDK